MVLGRIQRSIKRLREFPFSGPVSEVIGCRELVVPNTPYTVYFRVSGDTIEIVAILHGAHTRPDAL
jgi:toxin ParE1/3/4